MSKTAILNVADQGPLESLVLMLQSVGYKCCLPTTGLRDHLRKIGCEMVLDPVDLTRSMGYDPPFWLPAVPTNFVPACDLFVDVKVQKNHEKLVNEWPPLLGKILWYRINGGQPEHVINIRGDHGDEMNPPTPILTPNMWYSKDHIIDERRIEHGDGTSGIVSIPRPAPWAGRAYACWPPFHRFDEYFTRHGRTDSYTEPVCLIHNLRGWGYEALIENARNLGVKCYGAGSPDGLLKHSVVPSLLSSTRCMVHMKSNDAPGYALYEALAAACPVVCTRRLIWRNCMHSLFEPDKTCLVFDQETHDGLTEADVRECTRELAEHLNRLSDPAENRRIGEAGRKRLQEVMWNETRPKDLGSLDRFMKEHFG